MLEKNVIVKSGDIRLAGTLCLPSEEGSFPCVLMIHGSGPLNRDENCRGFPANIFNTMAHYMAERGIASLRYDKRGCGKSGGSYWDTGFYDLIQDAKTMYDYLLKQTCIRRDRIFLLGHSEGGIIAPKISLTYTSVAGLILIATTVDKLDRALKEQAQKLSEDITTGTGSKRRLMSLAFKIFGSPEKMQATTLKKVRETQKPCIRIRGQRLNARWLREILDYDPVYTMRNVKCPVLAITGEKDIQVNPQDTARIAELAKGEVEHHIIPGLTHLLRREEGQPSILNYKRQLRQAIDSAVPELICGWLNKRV